MTKVDIISGFLGAGKTTFIKKLIEDVFPGERLVLIENEFGEIGIDGGFLKDAGVEITEMNSGCICCTLVGDFSKALQKVLVDYTPDRVIIEPSGVGKLSDVVKAIEGVKDEADIEIDGRMTVVDGKKAKIYLKNFGEFFNNQVEHASTIVISRTQMMTDEKVEECVHMLREKNAEATSEQFDVSDQRTLDEVVNWLMKMDYIPSFCTACYREGRTGDRFMALCKSMQILNCCHPNALMTLKEYLEDYASPQTRELGMKLIDREIEKITNPKVKQTCYEHIHDIADGKRDFRF